MSLKTITPASVQELFAYDGTADVVEVVAPSGVLRSASSSGQRLNHGRTRKTIFYPRGMEPIEIRLDTNVWAASGRAMASLVGFDFYGSPHFEGITDLDLVAPRFRFPYTEMHRSARMRSLYADRAKTIYLQGAQRVNVAAADIDDVQGGITTSKSTDVHVYGARFGPNFGGPTTDAVHPDCLGLVGGGSTRLQFYDSTVLRYPRMVFQGPSAHVGFRARNLWMAANVLPWQFVPDAGGIEGQLNKVRIWFTAATRYYREDSGHYASVPGKYWRGDPRINVSEQDVQVVPGEPAGPAPHQVWWDEDPLTLAKAIAA